MQAVWTGYLPCSLAAIPISVGCAHGGVAS